MKIVLVTGGFDPIHSGHIAYFNAAKMLGDKLIVGLNSDSWLSRKKGQAFLPFDERKEIIQHLNMVDSVIAFSDDDNTAIDAINIVKRMYPTDTIIFANGGDRTAGNIPEIEALGKEVEFRFGVGGTNKKNSSSWILGQWRPRTDREWGSWAVLSQLGPNVKVKELVVHPGKKLSMQRHAGRNELWFVSKGIARVNWQHGHTDIKEWHTETIIKEEWHQLENIGTEPLYVVEIQYGDYVEEFDIERL